MYFKNLEIEIWKNQFFDAILLPFFLPWRKQADAYLQVHSLKVRLEAIFKVNILSGHLILR
jgi:hypothetical protein